MLQFLPHATCVRPFQVISVSCSLHQVLQDEQLHTDSVVNSWGVTVVDNHQQPQEGGRFFPLLGERNKVATSQFGLLALLDENLKGGRPTIEYYFTIKAIVDES